MTAITFQRIHGNIHIFGVHQHGGTSVTTLRCWGDLKIKDGHYNKMLNDYIEYGKLQLVCTLVIEKDDTLTLGITQLKLTSLVSISRMKTLARSCDKPSQKNVTTHSCQSQNAYPFIPNSIQYTVELFRKVNLKQHRVPRNE